MYVINSAYWNLDKYDPNAQKNDKILEKQNKCDLVSWRYTVVFFYAEVPFSEI